MLDAGREAELSGVTVVTDTPGFTAEVRAGDAPTGPFRRVSASRTTGTTTRFAVDGDAARYYVVWITALDGFARVNEVRADG